MTATAVARTGTGTGPTPPPRRPRPALAQWAADLALGVRLSVSGGRAGWVRLALIAVGIGLGVAMLLGAATAPAVVAAQQARVDDRGVPLWVPPEDAIAAGPDTVLTAVVRSQLRDSGMEGLLVQAEGRGAARRRAPQRGTAPPVVVATGAARDRSRAGRAASSRAVAWRGVAWRGVAWRGVDTFSDREQITVPAGMGLLLLGVALLLPWLVEVSVRHLGGGGGVACQLSVHRLQLDSGTSVRAVSGIAVSVAGLLVVNGMVAGLESGDAEVPQRDATLLQAAIYGTDGGPRWAQLADARGVREISTRSSVTTTHPATGADVRVEIGECAALAVDTEVGDCADGDVFTAAPTKGTVPTAGTTVDLAEPGSSQAAPTWTVPDALTTVPTVTGMLASPEGEPARFFITPGALEGAAPTGDSIAFVTLDPTVPDAMDHLRTAAAQVDASEHVDPVLTEGLAPVLADIRQALLAGTAALLLLFGASLLVNVVEQMRERRQLLAALLAFGVRRRTLSASVLLQLAVPELLGLALAAVTGTGPSTLLQIGIEVPVRLDWAGIGTTSGVAALVGAAHDRGEPAAAAAADAAGGLARRVMRTTNVARFSLTLDVI